MNTKTLARCYPSYTEGLSLSATQLISLHLMLNRPIGDGESMDSLFGPYISVMPRDFDSHPVTWVVRQRVQQATCEMILLENLTPSARTALDKVSQKFFDDWETTSVYMVSFSTPDEACRINNFDCGRRIILWLSDLKAWSQIPKRIQAPFLWISYGLG